MRCALAHTGCPSRAGRGVRVRRRPGVGGVVGHGSNIPACWTSCDRQRRMARAEVRRGPGSMGTRRRSGRQPAAEAGGSAAHGGAAQGSTLATTRAAPAPAAAPRTVRPPDPHPSGVRPAGDPPELIPRHVAMVMDGNGRWAKDRGLPRTAGHERGRGRAARRRQRRPRAGHPVPERVRVLHRELEALAGRGEVPHGLQPRRHPAAPRRDEREGRSASDGSAARPRLWASVIAELEAAEALTAGNTTMTLAMCVNYGGRAEIADAAAAMAADVQAGRLRPDQIDEELLAHYLDEPDMPDVDLFIRSSGEQRTSNFLLWQSAYAELVFLETLWPDFDRRHLWHACQVYASRDRRYGGAMPNELPTLIHRRGRVAAPAPLEPPGELRASPRRPCRARSQHEHAGFRGERRPGQGRSQPRNSAIGRSNRPGPPGGQDQAEEQCHGQHSRDDEPRQRRHPHQPRRAGVLEAGAQAALLSRRRRLSGACSGRVRGVGRPRGDGRSALGSVDASLGHAPIVADADCGPERPWATRSTAGPGPARTVGWAAVQPPAFQALLRPACRRPTRGPSHGQARKA